MHLLLEKGHLPADSVHAPLTPQCTPRTSGNDQDQAKSKEQPLEVKEKPEYSFVTKGEATTRHTMIFKQQDYKLDFLSNKYLKLIHFSIP